MEQKNKLITRFINNLMYDGNKRAAEKIIHQVLAKISYDEFIQAIENVKPALEIKSKRVGGRNFQMPIEISPRRQEGKAIKWLIREARKHKKGRTMAQQLTEELKLAYKHKGNAYRRKLELHKTAEANKAYIHFRW